MAAFEDFLLTSLEDLKARRLYRELKRIESAQGPVVRIDGREVILFSSNNYLGLASHPEIIEAQAESSQMFGTSSCASRLISGNMTLHEQLENRIASFKGTEAAIVFPAGYMANVGAISSLAGKEDIVVCDKLDHASIIDGAKMSGARMRFYPHKNTRRLRDILKKEDGARKKFIITDGVFSMDGDMAPLPEIVSISREFDAILMLDDAHGTGVIGPSGRGTAEHFGIEDGIDIHMGTLSKAIAGLGGFIAGSSNLIEFIRNKARSFIYTTSLPPCVLGGCIKSFDIIERHPEMRKSLWENAAFLRSHLSSLGFDIMDSETQIVPVMIGDARTALDISERLFRHGIFAPAIRPPTVPPKKCRIRFSVMATHTKAHIEKLLGVMKAIKDEGFFCNRH